MNVKNFDLPADLPLILRTIMEIHQTRKSLRNDSLEEIMKQSCHMEPVGVTRERELVCMRLRKKYRLVTWYYRRVLHASNPCFVRSLILYQEAKREGLNVRLVVGINKKNIGIEGHGWIEIAQEPFCEDADFLSEYQQMISW